MSKFYGTVHGDASQTDGTRRGFRSIKVAAQSWDGSVITSMHYCDNDLMVGLEFADDSSTYGQSLFYGTFQELKDKLAENNEGPAEDKAREALADSYDLLSCVLAQYENGRATAEEMYDSLCKLSQKLERGWR
jgi:hypothetical protein